MLVNIKIEEFLYGFRKRRKIEDDYQNFILFGLSVSRLSTETTDKPDP